MKLFYNLGWLCFFCCIVYCFVVFLKGLFGIISSELKGGNLYIFEVIVGMEVGMG